MSADSRKEYVVEFGGVKHKLLLSDEDAKRYGERAKQASPPQNKARGAGNK